MQRLLLALNLLRDATADASPLPTGLTGETHLHGHARALLLDGTDEVPFIVHTNYAVVLTTLDSLHSRTSIDMSKSIGAAVVADILL